MPTRPGPLLGATLAALLALGCSKPNPTEPLPRRAVRAVEARPRTSNGALPYAGGLEPNVKLDLTFGVAGRVRSVGSGPDGAPLREGQRVTKGQLLAQLDDSDLRRQAASASLAASSAEAEVLSAKAAAAQADADLERAKKLASASAVPAIELEKAETAAKTAHARLATLRAQHGSRVEQLAIARRVAGDARLTSPIDGVIARRMVDPGEHVSGQAVAFTVIDTTEMKLVLSVPDARISAVALGQLVPVHTDALPDTPLIGRVTVIHPVADPALRTFTVELSLDNADGRLRAGMVASAALGDNDGKRATLVPLASVVRAPDGKLSVFVLADQKATRRDVGLGDLVANEVVVESGVRAGELVVTDGAPMLHDGEPVEVVP